VRLLLYVYVCMCVCVCMNERERERCSQQQPYKNRWHDNDWDNLSISVILKDVTVRLKNESI
jgi:hypothetical protein